MKGCHPRTVLTAVGPLTVERRYFMCGPCAQLSGSIPVGGDGAALGGTLNYFAGHQERLGYAVRLRREQVIGSGMVEGTIKQLLNRRLKQTGARWKTGHVGPFVELGALAAGPEWQEYWKPQ